MGLGFMAHARSSLGVSSQASVSTSVCHWSPGCISGCSFLPGISSLPWWGLQGSSCLCLSSPPVSHSNSISTSGSPVPSPSTLHPTHIISSLLLPCPFQDLSLVRIFWAFLSVPPMHNTKGVPFKPLRHQTQKPGRAGSNW